MMELVAMIRAFRLMKNLQIMPSWHLPPQAHQVLQVLIMSSESDDSVPTSPMYDRYKSGEGYHVVPLPYTKTFMPPKPDLVFNDAPPASETVPNVTFDSEDASKPESVSNQKEPSFVQTFKHLKPPKASVKTVEHPKQADNLRTDNPKSSANGPKAYVEPCNEGESSEFARMTHPHFNRHVVPTAVLTRSRLVPLNAARPVTTAVHPLLKSQGQSNMLLGSPQQALQDKGVIDSGCSRHMTGNISYLSEFEEINRGYVIFGGNPECAKITGKGKIQTGKLDFDDVYFVKELKFNLFSVLQMCDKKNNVLFTDTECVVLSSGFKLLDENHVVPRENKMYNVDLKNVVLSGDLNCLFAKATFDESNLWHRRRGHIYFKTINNHPCVTCKKGKQHRASCKSKPVSSVSHPLQKLQMDLFGPTFIKSLNKKSYCLVVTDDYSRVLVTKSHNKRPYELLLGRTPSIGFMRPFRCLVTNLNTLDPLGKFDGKADDRFLVGYSVNSKAFRVFKSRTRIVQETLHINSLEKKPNVAGSIKENLDAGKVRKETISAQQYVLLPLWSTGSQDPYNTDADAAFYVKENKNEVHVSPRSSYKPKKHDNKEKREDKGKNHVDLSARVRDLIDGFEEFSVNSTNRVNAFSASVTAVGQITTNSTKSFNAASPFDNDVRPTFEIVLVKHHTSNGYQFTMSNPHQELTSPEQTVSGKEQLIADNLPKIIVDFLNGHVIQYALLVNPTIYVSCIKQFWALATIKKANDVVKLRALIDGKRVIVTEDLMRQVLHFDDADGMECLPNEEIFVELTRMGYEKPPPKLTFYKAFFSAQWKFLIHTLIQCVSAKRNAWNEISCSMASAAICLATVLINNQVDDLSSYKTKYTSLALTQKVFATMRRIGKGFSGVETPLFATMLVQPQAATEEEDEEDKVAQALKIFKLKRRVKKLEKQKRSKSSGLKRLRKVGGRIEAIDADKDITLVDMETKVDLNAELHGRIERKNDDNVANKEVNVVEPTVFNDKEEMSEEDVKKMLEIVPVSEFKVEALQVKQLSILNKLRAEVKVSGSESTQDIPTDDPKEISKEDVKNMLEIVLVTKFKVEALQTQKPLVKDKEADDVDVYLYRSLIGSLMYLTASRPDIMFTVCACS
nr:hypothetical protein [Tanacetum cinerariifolium]